METRNISLTLNEAREWYNSNIILRDIALKAFTKEELEFSFKDIKSLKEACEALKLNYYIMQSHATGIAQYSRASAAMFKLNIVRKALNLDKSLHLTNCSESAIYHPYTPFVTESSTYYKRSLDSGEMEVIGKIKYKGTLYNVLGGYTLYDGCNGLGGFSPGKGIGFAISDTAFLGCASKEIAEHFGKYFGMLIIEAKFGDLPDFKIIYQ